MIFDLGMWLLRAPMHEGPLSASTTSYLSQDSLSGKALMFDQKWPLSLACDPWWHQSMKVPKIHLRPKFGHNRINGCEIICHKGDLEVNSNLHFTSNYLSPWHVTPNNGTIALRFPKCICNPSLVTIGLTVAKLNLSHISCRYTLILISNDLWPQHVNPDCTIAWRFPKSQIHLGLKFGHNIINGCKVICHKSLAGKL